MLSFNQERELYLELQAMAQGESGLISRARVWYVGGVNCMEGMEQDGLL